MAQTPPATSEGTARDVGFDADSALVVVDVQNDFADPEGGLAIEDGVAVLEPINDLVRQAKSAGAAVVYTQDWHPPDTPHFEKDGGTWPVHCVAETWGAELHPDLVVEGDVVRKGVGGEDGYSGFTVRSPTDGDEHPTGLADLLAEHGTSRTVIVGLATDVCVKETALDSARLGFDTTVVLEATRGVEANEGDVDAAVEEMRRAGITVR